MHLDTVILTRAMIYFPPQCYDQPQHGREAGCSQFHRHSGKIMLVKQCIIWLFQATVEMYVSIIVHTSGLLPQNLQNQMDFVPELVVGGFLAPCLLHFCDLLSQASLLRLEGGVICRHVSRPRAGDRSEPPSLSLIAILSITTSSIHHHQSPLNAILSGPPRP